MKRTKKFNQEWAEAIALMPYNLQASIRDAIRNYQHNGVVPEGLHPLAQALFIVIKPTIDARARRAAYQKERRQRCKVSCLRTPEPEAAETANPTEPMLLKSSEVPENVPEEKRMSSSPRQPNRFLRQVERARGKTRHVHSPSRHHRQNVKE